MGSTSQQPSPSTSLFTAEGFQYPILVNREGSLLGTITIQLGEPLFHHHHFLTGEQRRRFNEIRNEVVSGTKKQELTSWWLQHIESGVDSFLVARGYDSSAVPFQYLDVPPRSLQEIQGNLGVVHSILRAIQSEDRTHDSFSKLLLPLASEIYMKIAEFQDNLKLVVWDELSTLGCQLHCPSALSLERTQRELRQLKEGATLPATLNTLKELVADLEYIEKMKVLEAEFFVKLKQQGQTSRAALSDIVPISGLILGKLHRLDNELKTVYNHWERRGGR
jgi:hypothetical protein